MNQSFYINSLFIIGMNIPQVSVLVINFGEGRDVITALQSQGYPSVMIESSQLPMTDLYRYTHIILSDSKTRLSECGFIPDDEAMLKIVKSGAKVLGIGFGYHLLVYYMTNRLAVIRKLPLVYRANAVIQNKLGLTDPRVLYHFDTIDYVAALNEKWDVLDYTNVGLRNGTFQMITIAKTKRSTGVNVMGVQFNPEKRAETYPFFRMWVEWA